MPSVDDLVKTMLSRPKAWFPVELTAELGITAPQLARLVMRAKDKGHNIYRIQDERFGSTNKLWIRG